jgi:hypothetical protein
MLTWLARVLLKCLAIPTIAAREPDEVIGQPGDVYLQRWFLFGAEPDPAEPGRTRAVRMFGLKVYLHRFLRSDDDRANHDHPGDSLSLGLGGLAIEHTIAAGGVHHRRRLRPGQLRFRRAEFAHRIELVDGAPYLTLFIFGPNRREWGFHFPRMWIHWKRMDHLTPEQLAWLQERTP